MTDEVSTIKTPHSYRHNSCGYDPSSICENCGANNYQDFGTATCEDYKISKEIDRQIKSGIHAPTNDA